MKNKSKKYTVVTLLYVVLFLAASVGGSKAAQESESQSEFTLIMPLTTEDNQPPFWSDDCARTYPSSCLPAILTLQDMPSAWIPEIQTAATTWSNIGTRFKFSSTSINDDLRTIEAIDPSGQNVGIKLAIGEVRVVPASKIPAANRQSVPAWTWPYKEPNDLSKTIAVLLVINDIDYQWSLNDSPSPSEIDLQSIVLHEFGHVVGLGHSVNPLSVMFPVDFSHWFGILKRTPINEDIDNVVGLYGPISPVPSPDMPILAIPINGSEVSELRPSFQWQPSEGSTTYFFQLSEYANFSQVVINLSTSTTQITPSFDLRADKSYFWRVKASTLGKNSDWSERWKFQLTVSDPYPELDSATFISDVTLPDGAVVSSGQSLTKIWRMQNTGNITWGSGYQLVFLRGDQMGAPSSIDVPVTTPGQEVDLSVNLAAPTENGNFAGYWRLRNSQGTYFGPEIWVSINVQNPGAHLALFTADPISPADTTTVIFRAKAENFPDFRAMRLKVDGDIKYELGAPEITYEWSTQGYSEGAHSVTVEAASWADLDWSDPEILGMTYTLLGNTSGSNHAPNPPLLTSPGDWAVYEGSAPSLQAQQNGDPDGDAITEYYFEIFDSHDTPNSGWITSNSWTPPGLGYYGYQWRVKVRDGHGSESGWSDVRHFNLRNPTPQIYDFHWEWCRDAWGGPEKICFCAQTSGGGLELKLNSANDGSDTGTWKVIGHGDTNLSCNNDNDRPPNWGQLEVPAGLYRVRLYQRPNVGGWDDATTADVVVTLPANQRPGTPGGLFPLLNSYIDTKTIDFQWNMTYRTDYYHFLAASDAGFTNIIVDQANILPNITTLHHIFDQDYPTVYWKVISTGPYGTNQSDGQFHIDLTPSTSVITSLPAISFDNQFTVNWFGSDERSGLRWYDIQVRDGNRPDSQWMDWLVNTTKTAEIFQGQVGHTYYFRVRSMDNVGNWEDWPTENGDTFTKIDPASAPPTPWWDNNYTYKRNLVILNNDTDWMPPHYPIHLHFDDTTTPTAEDIYNASVTVTKGNDIRVVYNNTTELDRFVQRFTSSQVDIWFPMQVGLGGGATDSTSYQIYYGNSNAGTPLENINSIFLPVADGNTMGLWHFQDGGGGTVVDSSNRNHVGTFTNPGWADGLLGITGAFNGSNAYVEVPHTNDLNLGAMTLEAWIYLNGYLGDHPMIISKDYYWLRVDNDRKLWFSINADGGGRIVVSSELNMNQWYHVAATYDGNGHMRIYINGQESGSRNENPFSILYTAFPFRIGRASNGDPNTASYFPGYIQHVRVSNTALTDFPYARINVSPSAVAGIQQSPPIAGNPDLVLLNLITYPNPDGGLLVQAVFQNQGIHNTQNGFYADLYIDHLPTGPGDYTGSLSFWVNDPIAAGSTVTLTTVVQNLSNITGLNSLALTSAEEINFTLYAQIDSTGAVIEQDNNNNIYATGTGVCLASPDAYENDGTAATATLIAQDQSQLHNFDSMSDEDWFKFEAQAGITYTLRTLNLGMSSDTYLYLYDTDGSTLLASNDDYGGSLASLIKWRAPEDGTYYVLVRHWNPNMNGCGTRYTFVIGDLKVYMPLVTRLFP